MASSLLGLWKRFVERVGDFQARAILTILYFTLFIPPSIIAIALDALKLRFRNKESEWVVKEKYRSMEELRRQW